MKKRENVSIALFILSGILFFLFYFWMMTGDDPRGFFLAGAVLLVAAYAFLEKGFLKKSKKTLRSALHNLRWNLALVVILDILLLLSVIGMVVFGGNYLNARSNVLIESSGLVSGSLDPQDVDDLALVDQLLEDAKGLVMALVWGILLFLFGTIIAYSFFKWIIWKLTYAMRLDASILRFFLLNLFWLPAVSVVFLMFVLALREEKSAYIILMVIAVLAHLTIVLNGVFMHTEKVWSSIKKAFVIGFARGRYFLIPYFLISLILIASYNISLMFPPGQAFFQAGVMMVAVFPLIMAFGRVYLAQVIKENL